MVTKSNWWAEAPDLIQVELQKKLRNDFNIIKDIEGAFQAVFSAPEAQLVSATRAYGRILPVCELRPV